MKVDILPARQPGRACRAAEDTGGLHRIKEGSVGNGVAGGDGCPFLLIRVEGRPI
jgi:hypothetical protein